MLDPEAKATTEAVMMDLMTVNAGRAVMGVPPVPWGDRYWSECPCMMPNQDQIMKLVETAKKLGVDAADMLILNGGQIVHKSAVPGWS